MAHVRGVKRGDAKDSHYKEKNFSLFPFQYLYEMIVLTKLVGVIIF